MILQTRLSLWCKYFCLLFLFSHSLLADIEDNAYIIEIPGNIKIPRLDNFCTLNGYVVNTINDVSTLENVSIFYKNKTVITNHLGKFTLDKMPCGEKQFIFKFTYQRLQYEKTIKVSMKHLFENENVIIPLNPQPKQVFLIANNNHNKSVIDLDQVKILNNNTCSTTNCKNYKFLLDNNKWVLKPSPPVGEKFVVKIIPKNQSQYETKQVSITINTGVYQEIIVVLNRVIFITGNLIGPSTRENIHYIASLINTHKNIISLFHGERISSQCKVVVETQYQHTYKILTCLGKKYDQQDVQTLEKEVIRLKKEQSNLIKNLASKLERKDSLIKANISIHNNSKVLSISQKLFKIKVPFTSGWAQFTIQSPKLEPKTVSLFLNENSLLKGVFHLGDIYLHYPSSKNIITHYKNKIHTFTQQKEVSGSYNKIAGKFSSDNTYTYYLPTLFDSLAALHKDMAFLHQNKITDFKGINTILKLNASYKKFLETQKASLCFDENWKGVVDEICNNEEHFRIEIRYKDLETIFASLLHVNHEYFSFTKQANQTITQNKIPLILQHPKFLKLCLEYALFLSSMNQGKGIIVAKKNIEAHKLYINYSRKISSLRHTQENNYFSSYRSTIENSLSDIFKQQEDTLTTFRGTILGEVLSIFQPSKKGLQVRDVHQHYFITDIISFTKNFIKRKGILGLNYARVASVQVNIINEENQYTIFTKKDGTFTLKNIKVGYYTIKLSHPEFEHEAPKKILITKDTLALDASQHVGFLTPQKTNNNTLGDYQVYLDEGITPNAILLPKIHNFYNVNDAKKCFNLISIEKDIKILRWEYLSSWDRFVAYIDSTTISNNENHYLLRINKSCTGFIFNHASQKIAPQKTHLYQLRSTEIHDTEWDSIFENNPIQILQNIQVDTSTAKYSYQFKEKNIQSVNILDKRVRTFSMNISLQKIHDTLENLSLPERLEIYILPHAYSTSEDLSNHSYKINWNKNEPHKPYYLLPIALANTNLFYVYIKSFSSCILEKNYCMQEVYTVSIEPSGNKNQLNIELLSEQFHKYFILTVKKKYVQTIFQIKKDWKGFNRGEYFQSISNTNFSAYKKTLISKVDYQKGVFIDKTGYIKIAYYQNGWKSDLGKTILHQIINNSAETGTLKGDWLSVDTAENTSAASKKIPVYNNPNLTGNITHEIQNGDLIQIDNLDLEDSFKLVSLKSKKKIQIPFFEVASLFSEVNHHEEPYIASGNYKLCLLKNQHSKKCYSPYQNYITVLDSGYEFKFSMESFLANKQNGVSESNNIAQQKISLYFLFQEQRKLVGNKSFIVQVQQNKHTTIWELIDRTATLYVNENDKFQGPKKNIFVSPPKMTKEYLNKLSNQVSQGTWQDKPNDLALLEKNQLGLLGSAKNSFFRKANKAILESQHPVIKKVREMAKNTPYWTWNGEAASLGLKKIGKGQKFQDAGAPFFWNYSSQPFTTTNEQGNKESFPTGMSIVPTPTVGASLIRVFGNKLMKDWSGGIGIYGCATISSFLNLVTLGKYEYSPEGYAHFAAENLVTKSGGLCPFICASKKYVKPPLRVNYDTGRIINIQNFLEQKKTINKILNTASVITLQMGNGFIQTTSTHFMPLIKAQNGWTIMDFNASANVKDSIPLVDLTIKTKKGTVLKIGRSDSKWNFFWYLLKKEGVCLQCKPIGRGVFIGKNVDAIQTLFEANQYSSKIDGFIRIIGYKENH